MIGLFTSRLAGPIGAGLSLILALTLAWVIISKDATISGLRDDKRELAAKVEALADDLHQCLANRITLEDATLRQSEAVALAASASASRLKALEKANAAAVSDAAKARARADRIMAAQGTGNACADADALILRETAQ